MSTNKNNKNIKYVNKTSKSQKDNLSELIFNSLNDIEYRTKSLKIKDIKIKENIRSIKLKEKKYNKINEEITTKKEELKLLKELLYFKEEKKFLPEDIINSYLDFFISTNFLLDDKLNSLMRKDLNINKKQRILNKLIGKENNDDDYDIPSSNNNIDISKFYLKPKKNQKIKDSEFNGDNLDNFFINHFNNTNNSNNNVIRIQRNNFSSGTSAEKISNGINYRNNRDDIKYSNNFNINKNKELTKFQKYNIHTVDVSKFIKNNSKENSEKDFNNIYNNIKNSEINSSIFINISNNISNTDINDYQNYNLRPNPKLRKARETFKKLLNKMNKKNLITFSNNKNDGLKNFILNVLNTSYFLRKILNLCYEVAEVYNINKQNSVETIHDNSFLSKLIENYEDVGENYDLNQLNNIKVYEKGLEEIKKITLETKQLEKDINQFAQKINVMNDND